MDFSIPFHEMVVERFQSEWAIEYPSIPIEIEGIPFKQPKTGPWVKFTIMQNPAKQKTLGKKVVIRTDGFLQIDVIDRVEQGTKNAKRWAEYAANIFFSQKFKTAEISAIFDEKHIDKAPTTDSFIRYMARIFFVYDGLMDKPSVQFL